MDQVQVTYDEIKTLTRNFLDGWQDASICLDEFTTPACEFDFTIFDRGLAREELELKLNERPFPVDYADFSIVNYVCKIGPDKAVQSFELFGRYASMIEGRVKHFNFAGQFNNTVIPTENGWKYSRILFQLHDDDTVKKPRYFFYGLYKEDAFGDASFVPGWHLRDDRLGWFDDYRIPAVCGETDAPWRAVPNPIGVGTDEDQIRETFYKYAYALDNYFYPLLDEVFTKDAIINFSDKGCHDYRSVVDYLKLEMQASTRAIHDGYVPFINVTGDAAYAEVCLLHFSISRQLKTLEEAEGRGVWGKYRLQFKKEDGFWRIKDLRFYLADETVYKLK